MSSDLCRITIRLEDHGPHARCLDGWDHATDIGEMKRDAPQFPGLPILLRLDGVVEVEGVLVGVDDAGSHDCDVFTCSDALCLV